MPRTRWLWAAALLVLCTSAMAGAAFGADSWNVLSKSLPTEMIWDQSAAASVKAGNNGTTTWNTDYALRSVQGTTAAAFEIDRWTSVTVPVTADVAPGGSFTFSFTEVAPPITTLEYAIPFTATTPPTVATLPNDWMMKRGSDLIRTDVADGATTIERFPDMLPSTGENWAAPFVEELAGHVPVFVQGFPGNPPTYRPTVTVTRDQMAVFITRAVFGGDQNVPSGPATPSFTDVPTSFWAYKWIEAAVAAGVVVGYPDDTYRPEVEVSRDQMAVFVSRGMAGGDANVPPGPITPTFPDVPTDYWAYKYVEYAAAHNVVTGYPNGTYQPLVIVTRDQMAVFIYRGFVQPTGALVVLAGPAITRIDDVPAGYFNGSPVGYDGWSNLTTAVPGELGVAYVALDAVRLSTALAPITVTFDLREVGSVTEAFTASVVINAAEITAAKTAVVTSGGRPYVYATVDIDTTSLEPDQYTLTVTINGFIVPRAYVLEVG